jgi:hypothetical protein
LKLLRIAIASEEEDMGSGTTVTFSAEGFRV